MTYANYGDWIKTLNNSRWINANVGHGTQLLHKTYAHKVSIIEAGGHWGNADVFCYPNVVKDTSRTFAYTDHFPSFSDDLATVTFNTESFTMNALTVNVVDVTWE